MFIRPQWGAEAAPAYPEIEGFATSTSGSLSNMTVSVPSGIVSGNNLLLFASNDTSGGLSGFNTPAGWTSIGEVKSNLTDVVVAAWWKTAGGSESDFALTWNGSNSQGCIVFCIHTTSTATTPIDLSNFVDGNSIGLASYTIPSITTTVANTTAFYCLGFDGEDGQPFSESSTGWIEQDQDGHPTPSGNGSSSIFGSKVMPAAGATGNVIITPNTVDGACYFQLAIKKTD